MSVKRLHAFGDDALGEYDGVALAAMVRSGVASAAELADAATARAGLVAELGAVAHTPPPHARPTGATAGRLAGVPTFLKDNTDIAGMPSNHGSEAFSGRVAKKNGRYTEQFVASGMTVLGKSQMPEFGFNASTEFMTGAPTRNPWNTDHSVGASSGGAASLVAAGVVPLAHANDGGGSIRIPAACAGLVGLKPSRGRHLDGETARIMPVNIVSEGVVSRTVRDTAAFVAAMEDHWANPKLPRVGLVEGPSDRKLRIGLVLESVNGVAIDAQTRTAVEETATLLEKLGHRVEASPLPVDARFADDFALYWAMLAKLASATGSITFGRPFDKGKLDGLTVGLKQHFVRNAHHMPGALRRLRGVQSTYAASMQGYDAVLSPVLAHVTPELGHLAPTQSFEDLMRRLLDYVTFTPLHNVAGSPGISVPAGLAAEGVPIGVHLSGQHGGEATLLELAYALEAERPFPRIS